MCTSVRAYGKFASVHDYNDFVERPEMDTVLQKLTLIPILTLTLITLANTAVIQQVRISHKPPVPYFHRSICNMQWYC